MTEDHPAGAAGAHEEDSEDPGTAQPPAEVAEPVEVVEPASPSRQGASAVSVKMVHRQAPLPAPSELRSYFDISEFVGNTIVEMARDTAKHRHRMERRSFWVILTVILCVTAVMLGVVWGAVRVAEVSVPGGVLILLASPTAVLWALLSRLFRRLRRQRSDAADEPTADEPTADEPTADEPTDDAGEGSAG